MASSKLKEPPALHQKRTTEEPANADSNVSVFKAFKKLKVNSEGGCVKKTEDQSEASLKHKPECGPGDNSNTQKEEASDAEAWSLSLQNFCLCDEGAFNKRGKSKWKSMCRFHQLRMRKDKGKGTNSLNLAQAVRLHKPLVQESRLKIGETGKVAEHGSLPRVMRSARFTFDIKAAKKDQQDKSRSGTDKITSEKSVPTNASVSPVSVKPGKEATAASRITFAASAANGFSSFSSLCEEGSSQTAKKKEPVPTFDGYRVDRNSGGVGLWPQSFNRNSSRSSLRQSRTNQAVPAAVARRLDMTVERSCSQEARLDESEFNVNELAAYFDDFLHMPKEMSSMAQMMYT